MKPWRKFIGLLAVELLGGVGCQHVERTTLKPEKTAFEFYGAGETVGPEKEAEAGEVEGLRVGVILIRARPIEPLTLPEYPDIPAVERSRWVTVGVRLDIDREGRVIDTSPSVICITTPHPRLAAFREVIEAAVAQWRFIPAEERHMEKVTAEDGTVFWRASRIEQVATSADISFTFTASGDVRSN